MVIIECPRCKYVWNYLGSNKYPCCPDCKHRITDPRAPELTKIADGIVITGCDICGCVEKTSLYQADSGQTLFLCERCI